MSETKPTQVPVSRFIESSTVDKETAGGSKVISLKLTSDAERALTVEPPKKDGQ
jgi:hypothetical protein